MPKLSQLALNDDGFVFNPNTGDSFQVSETGAFVLKALKKGRSDEEVAQMLTEEFTVTLEDAKRDCVDFRGHLKNLGLA